MPPSAQDHLRWARLMELDVDRLLQAGVFNWAAVAAFYSAMHYVQAYLHAVGWPGAEGIGDHRTRNNIVAIEARLRVVHSSYSRLFEAGWRCRYQGQILPREAVATLVSIDLQRVKEAVLPHVGE